ncbi:MAG TPA: hypothetical protein VG960_08020 [Caulobacteraceae bacterium]|nr:hypothetical protein [Caulobacteraceae bacterium]
MADTRIIALFNLKPGISLQAYESWARAVDLPTVNNLPSIRQFEVFRTTGVLGSSEPPPYSYIEIIDVRDMGQFGEDVATPVMQSVAKDFTGMAEVVFLMTEKITWRDEA